jgi:hypothetical protein
MDEVIVAGVRLPDFSATSEVPRDVKHRVEEMGGDVIAQELRSVVHVQRIEPAGAEVPPNAAAAEKLTAWRKEWPNFCNGVRRLVQSEQGRTGASFVPVKAQENPHLVAVLVRVAVAPV